MNKTQAIDPNRTMLSGDMLRTQAMPGGLGGNSTLAMGPLSGLSACIIPGRAFTMANGPAREQFLVEFQAEGAAGIGTRTQLNVCLVIDRSGSMEGPPLDYVKQACSHVVDLMSPLDVLSIVTFEEIVEVLMPPQRVTNKQAVKDGIARIQSGNTTNLYDGVSLAAQQLAQTPDPSLAARMIVFTDGDPTAGIKDFQALVQHVGEVKSRGYTCTFLGFGQEYNEELLAAMAKKAGGNYYYIPRPELIPDVFRSELDKLMTVSARNLKLEMKLARWVRLRSASGMAAPPAGTEFTLDLADLERGALLQQVFDFDFQNHPLGHYRVAHGRLTYEDCVAGKAISQDLDFVIEFTADSAKYSVAVNPLVAQAAEISAASRVVEKTIMGLKTGVISAAAAAADLQKTQMLLLNDGRTAEAQEVTLALRALQQGDLGQAEKTLMGTVVNLDQGKKQS